MRLIRRFVAVAAVAAVCLSAAAPAAVAAPAAPPQAGSARTAAELAAMDRWLGQIAVWGRDYRAVLDDASVDLDLLSPGLRTARDRVGSGDAGRRWVGSFAAERLEAFDALSKRFEALDAAPPPPPPILAGDPAVGEMIEAMKGRKAEVRSLLTRGQALRRSYFTGLERAMDGDESGILTAAEALLDLSIEAVACVLLLIEFQADLWPPDHPGRHVARAMSETIDAHADLVKSIRAEIIGNSFDPGATASAMEARLRQAELQLTTGEERLADMRRTADLAGTPSLKRKMLAIADSLEGTIRDQRDLVRISRERVDVLRRSGSAWAALDHAADAYDAVLGALDATELHRFNILTGD